MPEAGAPAPVSPLEGELRQLIEQQLSAYTSTLATINLRDKNLLEGIQRRASQSSDLRLLKKINEALEAVSFSAPFHVDAPASGKKQSAHEKELWQLKATRDRALEGAVKSVATRFRSNFERLQRRAIEAGDLDTAGKIAEALKLPISPGTFDFADTQWMTINGASAPIHFQPGGIYYSTYKGGEWQKWEQSGPTEVTVIYSKGKPTIYRVCEGGSTMIRDSDGRRYRRTAAIKQ